MGSRGNFAWKVVDQWIAIVEALDIDDRGDTLPEGIVHRRRRQAASGRVDWRDVSSYAITRAPRLGALHRFFIPERPRDNARMIPVAAYHSFQFAQSFGSRRRHARFADHDHAQTVAGIQ